MKKNMKDIVKEYLIKNNYDGLVHGSCGCIIDDLIPCEESNGNCCPGHIKLCELCNDFQNNKCIYGLNWCINE